jgi:hypothetical protein
VYLVDALNLAKQSAFIALKAECNVELRVSESTYQQTLEYLLKLIETLLTYMSSLHHTSILQNSQAFSTLSFRNAVVRCLSKGSVQVYIIT